MGFRGPGSPKLRLFISQKGQVLLKNIYINDAYATEKKIKPICPFCRKLPLFPDIKRKLFKNEFYLLYIFKENIFEKGDKDNGKKNDFLKISISEPKRGSKLI